MTSLPIRSVAADSNVLLAAIAGRAARRVFENAPELTVVTTEANIAEVEEYVPEFAARYGLDEGFMLQVLEILPIERYSERDYFTHVAEASRYLRDRDPDDVALAALALKLRVPIWSNDNDLNEVPLQIFTTAQLLKLLGI